MAVTNAPGILGEYEKNLSAATNGASDRLASDKDTFLKLLIAQLTHQDPMNPAEDKDFIAQLAQFTSVEELQKINKGIETLGEMQKREEVVSAASLLNLAVVAKGDNIRKQEGYIGALYADFPDNVADCTIKVYATHDDGSIAQLVRSEKVGAVAAEKGKKIQWDGKNDHGQDILDGNYIITISAKRSDGSSVLVETQSEGIVIGVKANADGNHDVYLGDGRHVKYKDVQQVYAPIKKDPTEEEKKTETEAKQKIVSEGIKTALEEIKKAKEEAEAVAEEATEG